MRSIYLIGGIARSGKSLIRKNLFKKHNIVGIDTDSLRAMFEYGNPQLGVSHQNNPEVNAQKMWKYIKALINNKIKYSDEPFAIEGDILLPQYLRDFIKNNNVKCCFVGYSSINPKEKLALIREYKNSLDWTSNLSNKDMLDFVSQGIHDSKKYKLQCEKYNIKYFDTSIDFLNVITEAVEHLVSN